MVHLSDIFVQSGNSEMSRNPHYHWFRAGSFICWHGFIFMFHKRAYLFPSSSAQSYRFDLSTYPVSWSVYLFICNSFISVSYSEHDLLQLQSRVRIKIRTMSAFTSPLLFRRVVCALIWSTFVRAKYIFRKACGWFLYYSFVKRIPDKADVILLISDLHTPLLFNCAAKCHPSNAARY